MAIGNDPYAGIGIDPAMRVNSLLNIGSPTLTEDMWKYLNTQETLAAAQNANIGAAQRHAAIYGNGSIPPTNTAALPALLATRAREMFLKRMGGIRAELTVAPGDFVQCHVHGETVYVFYCFAGREGVAKEGIDLFPSDQFITQFRLVIAT